MTARKQDKIRTFWILLPLLTFIVFTYPTARLSFWYFSDSQINWFVILLMGLIPTTLLIIGFRQRINSIKLVAVNWLGICFVFFSITLVYEIARIILTIDDKSISLWLFVLGCIFCVIGVLIAQHISVKQLTFNSDKLSQRCRIVQISDVHVGSRHSRFLNRIVGKINALRPAYVVITGDLVDTSRVSLSDLSPLKKVESPIYMIIGNHERYAGLDYVMATMTELGIQILRNETITIADIQLIGIDDSEDPRQVAIQLPQLTTNADKYRILLYHRPSGWAVAVQQNIELMLSGHTHNGQIYPFHWLVKRQFKHLKGLFQDGGASLYVSPGTGTWGPLMRLGSRNEITCIDLKPSE